MTIISEDSSYCGQSGRVRRVFWRQRNPWVLLRFQLGGITAVPWNWTDLPVPPMEGVPLPDEFINLLSPAALRDLVRFVGEHGKKTGKKKRFSS